MKKKKQFITEISITDRRGLGDIFVSQFLTVIYKMFPWQAAERQNYSFIFYYCWTSRGKNIFQDLESTVHFKCTGLHTSWIQCSAHFLMFVLKETGQACASTSASAHEATAGFWNVFQHVSHVTSFDCIHTWTKKKVNSEKAFILWHSSWLKTVFRPQLSHKSHCNVSLSGPRCRPSPAAAVAAGCWRRGRAPLAVR